MFCKKCKMEIIDDSTFCNYCGTKQKADRAKKNEAGYHRVTFTYEGKRYERKGKTLAEAHAKAERLKISLENGEVGISGNMTVKAWAEEWLEVYKRPTIGESQYIAYNGYINNSIVPAIGTRKLKDIKDVELQKILNNKIGHSKSDLTKLRYTIRGMFKRAHASGLISKNPAEFIEIPAAVDGTNRSITDKERKYILKVAETHPANLWIKLTLYCGLRPAEARALDWRHVDFDKKLVKIEVSMKAKTKDIGKPKSAAGIRNIPIPDTFIDELKKAKKGPFEPVLEKPISGKRHDAKSMTTMWNNFKRHLDIEMGAQLYRNKIIVSVLASDLVPYCLRHTYCTDLQDKRVPINIARYLMGHADISTTSKIYTHTTNVAIEDARDKINGKNKTSVANDVAQNQKPLNIG